MSNQLDMFPQPAIEPKPDVEWWDVLQRIPTYEVSSHGRFRNIATKVLLRGTKAHNGYIHIGLTSDGRQTFYLAHRIVAEAFLKKGPDHVVVNHINGVRDDNRASNLEWCTRSHNAKHAKRQRYAV